MCIGVGRDRSGGVSQCCAGGLLVVGSCPGSAAECVTIAADRVSQETGAGACNERDGTEVQYCYPLCLTVDPERL